MVKVRIGQVAKMISKDLMLPNRFSRRGILIGARMIYITDPSEKRRPILST